MHEQQQASSAQEQLAAIASLSSVLDQQAIEYWLFGGWAVDFWAGHVTRNHDDIDIAAWRHDYEAIRTALTAAGWRHTPAENEVVGTRYEWGTALAEFTFVVGADDGSVLVLLEEGPVVWSTESFGHDRRELHGVSCPVLPLGLLRAGKSSPRDGAADAAKDRADFEALSHLA